MTTMFHHDSTRSYEQAASDAAKAMREKLQKRIEQARGPGRAAIERILAEQPRDVVLPTKRVAFEPVELPAGAADDAVPEVEGEVVAVADEPTTRAVLGPRAAGALTVTLETEKGRATERVHPFALGQMAEAARIPRGYLAHLLSQPWGREVAALNLNSAFAHDREARLVRSVGEQARGFLSPKYRRLHGGMLLESFIQSVQAVGGLPYEAQCTDTRWMVRAVLETVIEPVPGEVIALGVVIHESAYGNGATEVSPFLERMWCTNQAVLTQELRKVHIGARLPEGIVWSDRTLRADTELLCAQMDDLVRAQLGPDARAKVEAVVRQGAERKVDPKAFGAWLKDHLTKTEAEGVLEQFRSANIEDMPAGMNNWRASNAISWYANTVVDPERKFELSKLAGTVAARVLEARN